MKYSFCKNEGKGIKSASCLIIVLLFFYLAGQAQNSVSNLSLNGLWEVEESIDSVKMPKSFNHKVMVPGLTNQSVPGFKDVDNYTTSDLRFNLNNFDEPAILIDTGGVTIQNRNYFWYKKRFKAGAKREIAHLTINKAQFGSTLWINGKRIGTNWSCFSSKTYNISEHINWGKENEVVIRIGAHPNALPKSIPYGLDYEKYSWTPGIYDDVTLHFCDNPVIEKVQIAPNIHQSTIVVQTMVTNYRATGLVTFSYEIREWKSGKLVNQVNGKPVSLILGVQSEIRDTIKVPDARLWNTETPFLYTVNISTGGDNVSKRFGMREFRFDTPTKRAYLNDTLIFLRGSNITLHRFFEDPKCGSLPWDENWVRKMLAEIPKSMNWNSFRFCIGAVPDKWLDIADEEGILIQNEYFIWTLLRNDIPDYWDLDELYNNMKDWVSDSWNHPSVVIWDAMNETRSDKIAQAKIVDRLRSLDLSGRTWESSWNNPAGADDPVEFHSYLLQKGFYHWDKSKVFKLQDLETLYPTVGVSDFRTTGHAMILNEYGWLWLNRDGSPTLITQRMFDKLVGPESTEDERRQYYAYALGGLTEYWRAYRIFAGVQYFVYLTYSKPTAFTSDNFINVETLELDPYFKDYMHEAFKPVGVYLNFWQPTLKSKSAKRFVVMMVNDNKKSVDGILEFSIEDQKGKILLSKNQSINLNKFGQSTYYVDIEVPDFEGECLIRATAKYNNLGESTVSRRKVKIEK